MGDCRELHSLPNNLYPWLVLTEKLRCHLHHPQRERERVNKSEKLKNKPHIWKDGLLVIWNQFTWLKVQRFYVSRTGKTTQPTVLCLWRKRGALVIPMIWINHYTQAIKLKPRIKQFNNWEDKNSFQEERNGVAYPKSINCKISPNAAGKIIQRVYIPRKAK